MPPTTPPSTPPSTPPTTPAVAFDGGSGLMSEGASTGAARALADGVGCAAACFEAAPGAGGGGGGGGGGGAAMSATKAIIVGASGSALVTVRSGIAITRARTVACSAVDRTRGSTPPLRNGRSVLSVIRSNMCFSIARPPGFRPASEQQEGKTHAALKSGPSLG